MKLPRFIRGAIALAVVPLLLFCVRPSRRPRSPLRPPGGSGWLTCPRILRRWTFTCTRSATRQPSWSCTMSATAPSRRMSRWRPENTPLRCARPARRGQQARAVDQPHRRTRPRLYGGGHGPGIRAAAAGPRRSADHAPRQGAGAGHPGIAAAARGHRDVQRRRRADRQSGVRVGHPLPCRVPRDRDGERDGRQRARDRERHARRRDSAHAGRPRRREGPGGRRPAGRRGQRCHAGRRRVDRIRRNRAPCPAISAPLAAGHRCRGPARDRGRGAPARPAAPCPRSCCELSRPTADRSAHARRRRPARSSSPRARPG